MDGVVGATRWAFAALVCRLAQDGHCTLIRTCKQRWLTAGPVITVDLHADPTSLSPIEETILRQLVRHDTLEGFGFAGSTFRRRTLREVRSDLIDRGWLEDQPSSSNALLALGAGLLTGAVICATADIALLVPAALSGLGTGNLVAAGIRCPLTTAGARRRAAHQGYAVHSATRIQKHLSENPERAAALLLGDLPHLILQRWATPQRLRAVADRCDACDVALKGPDWIQSDGGERQPFADFCRDLAAVLAALGARTPLRSRLRLQVASASPPS